MISRNHDRHSRLAVHIHGIVLRGLALGFAVAVLGAGFAHDLEAQTGTVVGRVATTEGGSPISTAEVMLPSIGLGTLTRADGSFAIANVPPGTYEIRVSRIGLTSATAEVTVAAGASVPVNLTMGMQPLSLDALVVTGTAGASRRREIGNSIAQINVADVLNKPFETAQFLQSAAPGIQVSRGDGGLGQGYSILLRGNSTVSMTNQPIIYVDGVRLQSKSFPVGNSRLASQANGGSANISANPLNDINPNDIERIEVIKGSAATTLYGTEASSGVIQVFTKRGSAGTAVWNFDIAENLSQALKFGTESHPYLRMDPYLSTGRVGSYSASVRGGAQGLQYFVSGSVDEGSGILPGEGINKYVARGNFTLNPTPTVQLQWNSAYTSQNQTNGPVGGNVYGITLNAYRGIANYINSDNPEDLMRLFDQDLTIAIQRFTTGGTITYTPGLNLTNRVTVGHDYSSQETRNVIPFGFLLFPQGQVWNDTWSNRLLTLDYVGTYSRTLTDGLRTSFSWGGQAVREEEQRINAYGENFPGAANPTVNSAATKVAEEARSTVWNAGLFAQNVFDLKDRYFLTLGARVDGNSTFGSGFGLQVYPKASASWVLSDERFWPAEWGAIKLRTAYGKAGRAPGAFDATRTWAAQGWAGRSALIPDNLGAPDLGPEVTAEFEVGFDGEWGGGLFSATFSYFNQTTTDALFNVVQTPTTGFSGSQRRNVGELNNTGIELGLNLSPVRTADWSLDLGLNVTTNHSKVVDLGGTPPFSVGGGWVEEGYPVPALRTRWLENPEEIGAPRIIANYIHGPTQPTLTWSPSVSLRIPGGVVLAATGEFRGGHYKSEGVTTGGVSRSGWMPVCWPWYVNPYEGAENGYAGPSAENSHALKAETPALYRALCNPATTNGGYTVAPADYFVVRSLSANVPVGFIFPRQLNQATLSVSLNNAFNWYNKEWRILTPEMGNTNSLVSNPGTGVPPTYSINIALRVQL